MPLPEVLGIFVINNEAAIRLGKALFWDMQAGSDGQTACASCHFQAGADTRVTGNMNPGPNGVFDFGGPNHTYSAGEFPFHQLVNPEDRASARIRSFDDVSGGAGVKNSTFNDIVLGSARDNQTVVPDANGFSLNSLNLRRVTGRNTPSFLNAVFNVRNFWDGRANRRFNGNNPFGDFDLGAKILVREALTGEIVFEKDSDDRSSLASLCTGPPLNATEMSAAGRDFARLGKKMLSLRPLGLQKVHNTDSVLGSLAVGAGKGLSASYVDMIKEAFDPEYWDSHAIFDESKNVIPGVLNRTIGASDATIPSGQFTQMESNFAIFWGYAILMYGSTLVSDNAPFDQFAEGNTNALTPQQQFGLKLFMNSNTGNCISCHSGAEFTSATFSARVDSTARDGMIRRMAMGDGRTGVYDGGFYNIGVRPTNEDLGLGGLDPFRNPLSLARQEQMNPGSIQDNRLSPPLGANERVVADGMFKTPTLRNVELNGPYFHNGSIATLADVVQFYARGGNFHDVNIANLDSEIHRQRGLIGHPMRKLALTDFLRGLTDERVRYNRAPFDHPELVVQAGAPGGELSVLADLSVAGQAANATFTLPAVGQAGGDAVRPFLNLPIFDPSPIAAPNPVFSGMALFATDTLYVGTRFDTEGDLWSNGSLRVADCSGPRTMHGDITAGGDVKISGASTVINGSIMSRRMVSLNPSSGVTLDGGLVGSFVEFYAPLTMPALPAAMAGGRAVIVPENETVRLAPGRYRAVVVGRRGKLILSDGEYMFRRLDMKSRSTLLYDEFGLRDQLTEFGEIPITPTERTTLNIIGNLTLEAGASITSGDPERSTHLRINVLAQDGGRGQAAGDDPDHDGPTGTIRFENNTVFHGSLVAPRAKVTVAEGSSMQGAIYARMIEIGDRCIIKSHHLPGDSFAPSVFAGGFGSGAGNPTGPTTIEVEAQSTLMSSANIGLEFALMQNQPNPFRPSTLIRFALPEAREVRLEVFDIGGRMVKTLAKGTLGPGLHTMSWNGMGDGGTRLPTGVYMARLVAGKDQANRKMILMN